MKLWRPILAWLKRGPSDDAPPLLMTAHGPVTESARLAAALNMRDSRETFEKCVQFLMDSQRMTRDQAIAELKRRYPEAFYRN